MTKVDFTYDLSLQSDESDWIEPIIKNAVKLALAELGFESEQYIEISVLITHNIGIKNLNLEYRKIDKATDVLSFPQFDSLDTMLAIPSGELFLGDIVLSYEMALEQAERIGHGVDREIFYLTVHSVLHLCGFDHQTDEDKSIMRGLEKSIVKKSVLFGE